MDTQLQEQVKRLRQKALILESLKYGRPSLFLSPSDAAAVSVEAIYDEAAKGLDALKQYDDRFEYYLQNLFHPSSVSLQRELNTVAENEALDKQLHGLLIRLAPYMLEPSAHKVLEYLIRRFRVHEFNIDMLIRCVLPRHDNKIFARVLQLCQIQDDSKWVFLNGVTKHGAPIPRSQIIQYCYKNVAVLESICETVKAIIQMVSVSQSIKSMAVTGIDAILSFFTAIIVEVSEKHNVTDSHLRVILPSLFDGLNSNGSIASGYNHPSNQFRRCCCLVFVQLSRRIAGFGGTLKQAIFKGFIKSYLSISDDDKQLDSKNQRISKEILTSLLLIMQHQQLKMTDEIIGVLFSKGIEVFRDILSLISDGDFPVANNVFISELILGLFETSEADDSVINENILVEVLQLLLTRGVLYDDMIEYAVHKCVDYIAMDKSASSIDHPYYTFLRDISQQRAETFDIIMQRILANSEINEEKKKLVRGICMEVLSESKHRLPNESGLNVFLALNHPSKAIRMEGLKTFALICDETAESDDDMAGLCLSLENSLESTEFDLASLAWDENVFKAYTSKQIHYNPINLMKIIYSTLQYWMNQVRRDANKCIEMQIKIFHAIRVSIVFDYFNSNARGMTQTNQIAVSNFLQNLIFVLIHILFGSEKEYLSNSQHRSLEVSCYELCYRMRDASSIFSHLTKLASDSNIHECFVDGIFSAIIDQGLKDLFMVMSSLYNVLTNDKDSQTHESICEAYLKFLDGVVSKLSASNKTLSTGQSLSTICEEVLRVVMPTLMMILSRYPNISIIKSLLKKLLRTAQSYRVRHTPLKNDINMTILANDPGFRLLLLSLCDHSLVQYVASISSSFFPGNSIRIFLYIVKQQCDGNISTLMRNDLYSLMNSNSSGTISSSHLPREAKISSMHAIASIIGGLTSAEYVAKHTTELHQLFHEIGPIVIDFCSHSSQSYRDAGLCVATKICKITPQVLASLNMSDIIQDMLSFHSLITSKAALISVDGYILSSVVRDLMKDDASISETKNRVIRELLRSAQVFSIANIPVTLSVINLIAHIPLKDSWTTLKAVILSEDKAHTDNFDMMDQYKTLAKALIGCLQVTQSMNSEGLQTEIIETIMSENIIAKRETSTIWSNIVRQEILQSIALRTLLHTNETSSKQQSELGITTNLKSIIYARLVEEIFRYPGDKYVSAAMSALDVSMDVILLCMRDHFLNFFQLFDQKVSKELSMTNDDTMTEDKEKSMDEEENEVALGLTIDLERVSSLINVCSNIMASDTTITIYNDSISKLAVLLMELFVRLNRKDDTLRVILSLEYSMTVILDFFQICIRHISLSATSEPSNLPTTTPSKKNSRKKGTTPHKKGRSDSTEDEIYTKHRVIQDIREVLYCLSSARSISLQTASINVMKSLLSMNSDPNIIDSCLQLFSELLSSSSSTSLLNTSKEDLMRSILIIFTQPHLSPAGNDVSNEQMINTASSTTFRSQDILQPLCINFESLQSNRRIDIMNVAISTVGLSGCIPALTNILLIHSILSFDNDNGEMHSNDMKSALSPFHVDAMKNMIILSRSTQKKAFRKFITLTSEEIYRHSIDLVNQSLLTNPKTDTTHTADICMSNLVLQMKLARYLFRKALLSSNEISLHDIQMDIDDESKDETQSEDYLITVTSRNDNHLSINPMQSLKYFNILHHKRDLGNKSETESMIDQEKDISLEACVSLALITLEYVADILKSKNFHRNLVTLLESTDTTLQKYLLDFSEQLLYLISLSTRMQLLSGSKHNKISIDVYLGKEIVPVNCLLLGKTLEQQAMNMLSSMERLLDAPTFVLIMEEILLHENQFIRYKALQILSNRLESLGMDKALVTVEGTLFMDLMTKLRQAIQETLPSISSCLSTKTTHEVEIPQISLCQSALLCMDALTRYLTNEQSSKEWFESNMAALHEICDLAVNISKQLASVTSTPANIAQPTPKKLKTKQSESTSITPFDKMNSASYTGLIKLLGSVFLSCGTLCGSLGPKSLSELQGMTSTMATTLELQITEFKEMVDSASDESPMNTLPYNKARILLLRSTVSSLSTLIKANPRFIHPFIERILQTVLPLHEIHLAIPQTSNLFISSEISSLSSDVDICLDTICSEVPTRLLVGCVMKTVTGQHLFSLSHHTSSRFIQFLNKMWSDMPRNVVSVYSTNLCSLATLILDYRRVYGQQSTESDSVDEYAVTAVIDLCLKFTEVELKSFLVRLADWKDATLYSSDEENVLSSDENDKYIVPTNWRAVSRDVSFYHLIYGMASKLKVIFLPVMGSLWSNAIKTLTRVQHISQLTTSKSNKTEAKKSKRKQDEMQSMSSQSPDRQVTNEMLEVSKYILQAVTTCASHDNAHNLIDESRYDQMMPAVAYYLGILDLFESSQAYLLFCEGYVIPCLAALGAAIANDLQWKPLNHKILMFMRDKRKPIRMAALNTLRKVFLDIGEEYLILLPECLPFLSELMEDDDQEINSLCNSVIRNIEELAGEKLDVYLQ